MIVLDLANTNAAVIDNHCLKLSGIIDISSVSELQKKGKKIISSPIEMVDCSQIVQADSSCLAYLLYLKSFLDQPLKVIGLPIDLIELVKLYRLQNVFDLIEQSR